MEQEKNMNEEEVKALLKTIPTQSIEVAALILTAQNSEGEELRKQVWNIVERLNVRTTPEVVAIRHKLDKWYLAGKKRIQ